MLLIVPKTQKNLMNNFNDLRLFSQKQEVRCVTSLASFQQFNSLQKGEKGFPIQIVFDIVIH